MSKFSNWSRENLEKFAQEATDKLMGQEPRRSMTDEEIRALWAQCAPNIGGAFDFARLIERGAIESAITELPEREWVGLTDEEIWGVVSRIGTSNSDVNPYQTIKDARAIEAKLKELNLRLDEL